MIHLHRSLTFAFKDEAWVGKMLVGSALYLVPILNFALNGYGLDVLRNTARGEDVPLPKWDDLGRHLSDGLKLLVVQLIYSIPIYAMAMLMLILGLGFGISIEDVQRPMRDSLTTGFGVVMVILFCLSLLYGLFYMFIAPAINIQVARTGEISSALRFNEMLLLFKHRKLDYVLVFIVTAIPSIALGLVFIVLTILPVLLFFLYLPIMLVVILVTPYLTIVSRHWYGQLARHLHS